VNDAPTANPDLVTTETAIAARIEVLNNDTDPEGNNTINRASVQIVDGPDNGTVTVNPDGSISYESDSAFTGEDTFSYRVADAAGAFSLPATVTVTVNPRLNPWQNPAGPRDALGNALDVNDDGLVTILDALLVVNTLRDFGPPPVDLFDTPGGPPPNRAPFVDPTGDEMVTIADILPIINHLRDQIDNGAPEAEGESDSMESVTPAQLASGTGVIDAGSVDGSFPGYSALTDINSQSYFQRLSQHERDAALATLASDDGDAAIAGAGSHSAGDLDEDDDTVNLAAVDALFGDGFEV
jgi:hypothetical protein